MEPPEKIKASDVKILFPAGASANAHKGVVVLAFEIGEDGAIYGTTVAEDTAPDQQFRHSALGVASLLRWIPARMDGCPVNTRFTYTIDYALERRGRR